MDPDTVDATAPEFVAPAIPENLDTPCLLADLDVVQGNIRRMQTELDGRGVSLRPHAKTHKSIEVARMQLAAGARGITVGTLGEAEVFAAAGMQDVFVAYPVWAAGPKGERIRALVARADVSFGLDSAAGAGVLGVEVRGAEAPVGVLVEIDSGERRSGVAPSDAGPVARAAIDHGLHVHGVFTHGGHSYRRPGGAEAAAEDEVRALAEACDSLREVGIEPRVVSAGSTPTAVLSARGPVTEERAGTYVFGDRQQAMLGGCAPSDVGLVVVATVVSTSADHSVLDCGAKSLSKDRQTWMLGFGAIPAYPGAVISELFDYHAKVEFPALAVRPRLGEQVAVVPNHVCPVVNLFGHIDVVKDGAIVERWTVDAGRRSS